ncbi:unnamed protein product [Polarella glacialis]|uniref:C3H1-type domain-containing protein n=1 Tax=Polarella glacialis TaxID=89957 RepID=A0A813JA06_POLGL|nr:unnamed protein product [Polarella glacialis]|mmetsp:Transcript_22947/g.41046  ORF Transcript_22947/g.41046 Transcript_22947/m.41046 type:complete len:253 (-) Transcript_22947:57-815(-)
MSFPFLARLVSAAVPEKEGPSHIVWGDLDSSSDGSSRHCSMLTKKKAALESALQKASSVCSSSSSECASPAGSIRGSRTARVRALAAASAAGGGGAMDSGYPGAPGAEQGTEDVSEEAAAQSAKVAAEHEAGTCRPCLYFVSKVGCTRGASCSFCHLHPKKNRPRPRKAARKQCKEIASQICESVPDPLELLNDTGDLDAKASYIRLVLKGKERQKAAELKAQATTGGPASNPSDPLSPGGSQTPQSDAAGN